MKHPDFKLILQQTLVLFVLLVILPAFTLFAQNPDTVRIPFNRTEVTSSRIRLWQNTLYRWTVRGRAEIGVYSTTPMIADARYFTSNLGIPQLPQGPTRIPLDGNMGAAALCTSLQQMPTASPCNTFFATNARFTAPNQPLQSDATFSVTNALQMKQFAFHPDDDTVREDATYRATVVGGNDVARAIFVDGLGFANNQNYRDNPADTALVLRIERESPELLIFAEPSFNATGSLPVRILNDNAPGRVLRDTTVEFGSLPARTGIQTRRIVLRNRGITPLRITRIDVPTPNAAFSVTSSAGRLDNEIILSRMTDSVVITFTFMPPEARQYTQDIQISTNDPSNSVFTVRLRGAGALATLQRVDTLRFRDVSIRDIQDGTREPPDLPFLLLKNTVTETFKIESVSLPTSNFAVSRITTPQTITQGGSSNIIENPSVKFTPSEPRQYLDSLVIRGENLVDFVVRFTGRGVLAAASITRPAISNRTLDFGAVFTGLSTSQTLSIRNTGNLPLEVSLKLDPSPSEFYLGNEASRVSEVTDTISEVIGTTQTYMIRYTATPQISPGRKEAYLNVTVRDTSNGVRDSVVLSEKIKLIVYRLPNVIAPSRTIVSFDSVYVGVQARDTVTVRNTSPSLTGTFLRQGSISAPFGAESIPAQHPFPVGSASVLGLTFQPTQVGERDTVLMLESRVDSTSAVETARVQLRGTGVRQQFDLLRITSDSLFPNNTNTLIPASMLVNGTRTYIADIGCIRLGATKDVRVTFQNNGNLPFGVWNQFSRIEPSQTQDFTVVSRFQQQRRIPPDGRDTSLVLRFRPSPSLLGEQQIEYTLQSDIRQNIGGAVRIPTAPDSTGQIIIILLAKGIAPDIEPVDANVRMNDVTLSAQCGSKTTQRVFVRNPAPADCGAFTRVLSATLSSSNTPFRIIKEQLEFTVSPASTASVEVEFEPPTLGTFSNELVLLTDAPAPRDVVRIGLTGRAVELPNVNVSIATTHTAAPGTPIVVPILITPFAGASGNLNGLTLADSAAFQISYDRTLLEFDDVAKNLVGTAAEGGRVVAQVSNQGTQQTLNATVIAPRDARFFARETLVELRFKTYLGRETSSTLRLSGMRFGASQCPQIQVRTVTSGLFQTDSVCNLLPKVEALRNVPTRTVLAEVTPNPVTDGFGKITFLVNKEAHITLTLMDAQGASILTVKDADMIEGIYEERLPLNGLPTGTYFCEVRSQTASGVAEREVRRVVVVR